MRAFKSLIVCLGSCKTGADERGTRGEGMLCVNEDLPDGRSTGDRLPTAVGVVALFLPLVFCGILSSSKLPTCTSISESVMFSSPSLVRFDSTSVDW